jgi:hypothetical protein
MDHALQLALERGEPRDTRVDRHELTPCDIVGCRAGLVWIVGEAKKFPNGPERKTEVTGVSDEGQTLLMPGRVKPLIAAVAIRVR